MTPAELQALALALAPLACVFGLLGAVAVHVVLWASRQLVLLLGEWADRRQRIAQARMRSLQAHG